MDCPFLLWPWTKKAYFIFRGKSNSPQVAVVGLTLHTGAYLTEIFRAAYEAVPEGQKEAAKSIGMTGLQAFFRVIFPQAVTVALPHVCQSVSFDYEKYKYRLCHYRS